MTQAETEETWLQNVGFEILTEVVAKDSIFWDMAFRDFRNHHVVNLRRWLKQRKEDLKNYHRE
jgi:hypothetical protein